MANIVSFRNLQIVRLLRSEYARPRRFISTSGKNRETAAVAEKVEKVEEAACAEKNWVSYGFDYKDKTADRNAMNSVTFFSITFCMVFGGFIWAYSPDFRLRDWAHREAYLELRRREAAGLPPIDGNLVDPSKIVLPSDEELGDLEIVI